MKAMVRLGVALLVAFLLSPGCAPASSPGAGASAPPPPQDGGQAALQSRPPAPSWQQLVAAIPEGALPFPRDEVVRAWELSGGLVLLEQATNQDHSFYLYDEGRRAAQLIVGFIENASFEAQDGGRLSFLARGGDDTCNFDFPYRLWYDLPSAGLSREALYLPLTVGAAWGKNGWMQVLKGFDVDSGAVTFDFVPRPGEVLAGGHNRPLTTVEWRAGEKALCLRFYGVQMGDRLQALAGADGKVGLSVTPKVGQTLAMQEVTLAELPPGNPPSGAGLLRQGFPYGLALADVSGPAGRPSVEVLISTGEASHYTIETSYLDEGDVVRYTLRVR